MAASPARTVVVFDFDQTIVDCDSDCWVVNGLGATELFERLRPTMPWNALMNRMMAELHSQGRSIEDIANCLRKTPLDPHVAGGIKSASALGCELRIVSDANVFFVKTILEHHGLLDFFSEIDTNPCDVDDNGRIRISPYHNVRTSPPHGCPLCPPNLCKGMAIERMIRAKDLAEDSKTKTRFIYVGDGKGDYCPSLKLTNLDYIMPRKGFPLWHLIRSNPTLVRAEVHEWSGGEEQEMVLLHLISRHDLPAEKDVPAARPPLPVNRNLLSVPSAAASSGEDVIALPIPR